MFCKNCGKNVENVKFCPYCGTEVLIHEEKKMEKQVITEPSDKKCNKIIADKKNVIIAWSVLGVIILILIVMISSNRKSEKFLQYIEKEDYQKALEIYENELINDKEERQEAYDIVSENISSLLSGYYKDEMTYDDVLKEVNKYEFFYPSEVADAKDRILYLYNSQQSFIMAEEYYNNKEYEVAQVYYDSVVAEDSNYENARQKADLCYEERLKALLTDAETMVKEGQILDAIYMLNQNSNFVVTGDRVDLEMVITEYYKLYEVSVLNDAKAAAEAGKFENAVAILGYADKTYSEDIFNNKIKEYEQYLPIIICDIDPATNESGIDTRHDVGEDIYGNVYNGYYDLIAYKEHDSYVEFVVTGKQNYFSGTLFCPKEMEEEHTIYFEIYVDGIKVYETEPMSRKSQPISFDIEVEGASFIKVVTHSNDYTFLGCNPRIGLADGKIYYKVI